jgi:hypothetical protein
MNNRKKVGGFTENGGFASIVEAEDKYLSFFITK